MKKLRALCAALIICLVGWNVRADVFVLPPCIETVESGAFSGIEFTDGVYVPDSVTRIADDAFDETQVYGEPGSAAQTFAENNGYSFRAASITDISLDAPGFVSPYRPFEIKVCALSVLPCRFRAEFYRGSKLVFTTEENDSGRLSATLYEAGLYDIRLIVCAGAHEAELYLEDEIEVYAPVALTQHMERVPAGVPLYPIDEAELRPVTLFCSDPRAQIDGLRVTLAEPGVYAFTAQTEEGGIAVYTDFILTAVIPAESLIPGETELELYAGESYHLPVEVIPSEGVDLTWTSSDETVARVEADGTILALSRGSCVLTVSAVGAEAEVRIKVLRACEGLRVFPWGESSTLLPIGGELRLGYEIEPLDADRIGVSWYSDHPEVVRVDPLTGFVTALSAGDARVYAVSDENPDLTGSVVVHVYEGIASLSCEVPALLRVGDRFLPEPVIKPDSLAGIHVEISVSDPDILSLSDDGIVTAAGAGTASVILTAPEWVWAEYPVTVLAPCESIRFKADSICLNPGSEADMTALLEFGPEGCDLSDLRFSVSDGSVISCSESGQVTGKAAGSAQVIVTAGNAQAALPVSVITNYRVTSDVRLSSSYAVITQGSSAVLTPALNGDTAAKTGHWVSADENIVRIGAVEKNGTVTLHGVHPGQTTVTVITASGLCASAVVQVNPLIIKTIRLSTASVTLDPGEQCTLTASCLPSGADTDQLEWYSTDPSVADVDGKGLVTAYGAGNCVICVASEFTRAECTVQVNVRPMTSVRPVSETVYGMAGDSQMISYTFEPEDASPAAFLWTSDDPNVALADPYSGQITFVSAGETRVRGVARDGSGLTLTLTAVTAEIPLRELVVSTEPVDISAGETRRISYLVYPADASGSRAEFTSSDEQIATVDDNGLVTGRMEGRCTIFVTCGTGEHALTRAVDVRVTSQSSVIYRALVTGQFTTSGEYGFLPFSQNGTDGVKDALSLSAIDGLGYDIIYRPGSPSVELFRSSIRELALQADEDDVTVIYVITHGSVDPSMGYYLNSSSGIHYYAPQLIEDVTAISGHVTLVLCTCHSGRIFECEELVSLMENGGRYTGTNGSGSLSVICSSTDTKSSFYDTSNTSASYDFFTKAFTEALGWDMIADKSTPPLADLDRDGTVTLSELFAFSRTQTQSLISSYLQKNGNSGYSGNVNQFPSHFFAEGDEDLALIRR